MHIICYSYHRYIQFNLQNLASGLNIDTISFGLSASNTDISSTKVETGSISWGVGDIRTETDVFDLSFIGFEEKVTEDHKPTLHAMEAWPTNQFILFWPFALF